MIDPKTRADMDQAQAALCELLPPLWKDVYEGLKKHFSEQQSWELLIVYVFATSGGKGASK